MNSTNKTSTGGNLSDAEKALAALLPTTKKFTDRLVQGIRERESGWLRLNVKLVGGQIKTVQLISDESVDVNYSE